jgi:hypothetical protein
MGSESVGEISRPERKLNLGGPASRTLRDSLVTNREVTHATTRPRFGKWLVRAIQSLNGGMSHPGRVAPSLAGEQFWGRAVQASRDSLDSGALFIYGEGSERAPRFHFLPIALADMRLQTKDYLSRSFENIGTSSLFPDDKLR